jgi:probable HAF family extracellular repeat protein
MTPRRKAARAAVVMAAICATLAAGAARAADPSLPATRLCEPMSVAWDVNDAGTAAGYAGSFPNTRATTCSSEDVLSYLDLPVDATGSIAVAINDHGQVTGQISLSSGGQEAVVWNSSGAIIRLGFLTGGSFSSAQDINDSGWVAGVAGGPDGTRGFVWRGSGPIEALPTPSGMTSTVAQGINDHGAIAGTAFASGQPNRAIVWQDGAIVTLPPLADGATASAVDINDAGQVVGNSSTTGPPWFVRDAVYWDDGDVVDLGSLGGSFGLASAINANGEIAGYMTTSSNENRGFRWKGGTRTLLDPLAGDMHSFAFGLNGTGTIVGMTNQTLSGVGRAVSWTQADDTTPPELDVSVSPNLLWPPNHRYVTVHATVTATDDSGSDPTVELVSVISNEPDNNVRDGNTVNDVVTTADPFTFRLRAERDEGGSGRIYTVTYRATDASGNSATRSATVAVPVTR